MTKASRRLEEYYADFAKNGEYLTSGIAEGIENGAYKAINAVARLMNEVIDTANEIGEVASPSRAFARIGMYLDLGMARGLQEYSNTVYDSAATVSEGAIDGARYAMNSLSQMILDDFAEDPVIRPVLDLSEVQASAAGMSTMFGSHTIGLRSSVMASDIATNRTVSRVELSKRESSGSDLGAAVEALNNRIDQLSTTISNMQVVMETGALVGQIAPAMDRQLGKRASRANRGG